MGPPDVLSRHVLKPYLPSEDAEERFWENRFFVNFQLFHLWASGQKPKKKNAKKRHKPRKNMKMSDKGEYHPKLFPSIENISGTIGIMKKWYICFL